VTRKERQRHRDSNRERAARLPIHRAISDARIELALEDKHLVAEHHDLDVLVHLGPPRGSEQAEVTEGEGHGRSHGRWWRTLPAQGSDRGFGALQAHAGPIADDTLLYRVEFHPVRP
jgi:hypothetical protein